TASASRSPRCAAYKSPASPPPFRWEHGHERSLRSESSHERTKHLPRAERATMTRSGSSRLLDAQGGNTGIAQEFLVSPAMLDAVSPSSDRGGMVLGSGLQGEPLTMSA